VPILRRDQRLIAFFAAFLAAFFTVVL